jgi:hypothetical protein
MNLMTLLDIRGDKTCLFKSRFFPAFGTIGCIRRINITAAL